MTAAIPDIRGPKLSAFSQKDQENIIFVRLLSSEDEDYNASSVPHGRVFEIKVGAAYFALKIFRFFSLESSRPFVPYQEHLLDDDVVKFQMDPFFAECRAFGRLTDKRKDTLLAVRCYGYMYLSEAHERSIEEQFNIKDWNRATEDESQPLRGIVKELIRSKPPFGRKPFKKMKQNLEQLNKLDIYNMDIREGNYREGRLFDFSTATTSPHLSLWNELRSEEEILEDTEDDIESFNSMVRKVAERKEADQASYVREKNLRPRPKHQ